MSRKIFYTITLIAALITAAGLGCKGLSEAEQVAIKPITLNYWTIYNDVEELQRLANEYKAIRSYVTVNIKQVRLEEFDTLFINALAEDVGPDVVSMHSRWIKQYGSKLSPMPESVQVSNVTVKGKYFQETVITPVRYGMPSASDIRSQYVQTVGDDVIFGGKVYGIPLAMDTLAIYYNKDLLDKAGVPEPPSTWGEFLEATKVGTIFDNNGNIVQSGVALGGAENIENAPDILAMLMMQNGISVTKEGVVLFDKGLEKPSASHPAIEALRFYTDFARPTKDAYCWSESMDKALDNFVKGKSVFYFGFAFDRERIQARAPQMNLAVIAVPQLNISAPSNVANYWVESVVRKSKNQAEAWDFIRFMTTADKVKRYTDATKLPSPLRAHIKDQQEDEDLAPFVSQILTAQNWYTGRDVRAAENTLRKLISAYLQPYGEKDKPVVRDANLIKSAASIIKQTM